MEIESVSDFLLTLKKSKLDKDFKRFFRGHGDVDYKFLPGIFRNDSLIENEHKIYNDILIECPNEFQNCNSNSERLAIMQHYGVKTRLLDITSNPLIALFFACQKFPGSEKVDGMVIMIDAHDSGIKTYDSDAISILSALPKFSNDDKQSLKVMAEKFLAKGNFEYDDIKEFNNIQEPKNAVVGRLLHEIKNEKPAFENIIDPRDLMDMAIFRPQKLNDRIIRQNGAFIIFGLEFDQNNVLPADPFKYPRKLPKTSSKTKHMYTFMQIIIEKDAKENIIEELIALGITEASIYPELYKVAEFINDIYS